MVFGLRPHTNNKWDRNLGFTKSPSPSRGSTNTGNTDRFVKIIPGSRFQFWPSVAGTTCTRMPSSGSSTTCQTAAESSGRGHTTGQMWPCLDLKYVMKSGYPCSGFYQFKTFNVQHSEGHLQWDHYQMYIWIVDLLLRNLVEYMKESKIPMWWANFRAGLLI